MSRNPLFAAGKDAFTLAILAAQNERLVFASVIFRKPFKKATSHQMLATAPVSFSGACVAFCSD